MDHAVDSALVLGIDTGGTYTDGSLLDFSSRRVLASHKSLTTKRDFSIGIEQVIEGIHIEEPSQIRLVSVSTTLATNAIAEGKGKRVALLLIGYDPDLITTFQMGDRFATPHYYFFAGGHDLYGREKQELDLPAILAKVYKIKGRVDAIAVSSYSSPLNPEHETRVCEAVSRICDLPIVLGHQLSSKLGSAERATTAALNASLLGVLQDFVIAVQRAMQRRRIHAPLMVVRGDGTLMRDEFAARTPVETIHSGPAASAIGGRFLSGLDDALVVDVGGTTTDSAVVEGGQVTVSEQGVTVGDHKTSVRAANLLSIALGGDRHIALDDLVVLQALRQEQNAIQADDSRRLFDLDRKFHRAVARAAHNKYLADTLDRFFGLSQRLWYLVLPQLGFLPGAVEKHLALVEAIQAGRSERAEEVMRSHVQDSYDQVRAVLQSSTV